MKRQSGCNLGEGSWMCFTWKMRVVRRLVWAHLDSSSVFWWTLSRNLWSRTRPCQDYSPACDGSRETWELASRGSICFYSHVLVCVSVTSAVGLQMLLRVRWSGGYISRGASWEGEALWCWTLPPSWMDSRFCSVQQRLFSVSPQMHSCKQQNDGLTCVSSRIQSTEPERFPRTVNARTRLRTRRPSLPRTERRQVSAQDKHQQSFLKFLEGWPTCMDLSYQRFAPFFSRPPPCSISSALVASLGCRPLGSSRFTTHRQLSIAARESLLVWSGSRREAEQRSLSLFACKLQWLSKGETFDSKPFVSTSLACAHSVLPSDVRRPKGGSLSSAFSAIFMILSSWEKSSISLSCLLFAITSKTKN